MKKNFIKTKNVKKFTALMDELQKLPGNIPKLALVYGSPGLGKTQTIQWVGRQKRFCICQSCSGNDKQVTFI